MKLDEAQSRYQLSLEEVVYTEFEASLLKISTPEPGDIQQFLSHLQEKLDEQLDGNPPDAPTLTDVINNTP